jgi:hypothetical protein
MSHMEHPVVSDAVKGDADALAFLRGMAFVLHTWDDLVDRDHHVSDATVHRTFELALLELPRNRFYSKHYDVLYPILVQAIVNWRIANTLERQAAPSDDDFAIAFIIRSAYVDLLTMSANVIGGMEHAARVGVAIRRWAHGEGFVGYLNALATEKAARKGDHVLR